MALSSAALQDPEFNPELFLLPDEQDLLMTALNSNKPAMVTAASASKPKANGARATSTPKQRQSSNVKATSNSEVYNTTPGSTTFSNLDFVQDSAFLDYDLDEGNYDWDLSGEQMIGSLLGTSVDEETEHNEKRKGHDDDDDDDEGGGKRREGDDKTGKKPGRKLLTSEPTSKRKAQNRAAQRAFRERKERHLKELETKVEDLEKASESANHENGLLRAQVDRLQTELKEFRKRISLNGNTVNRSPSQSIGQGLSAKSNWDINNNFQFEFPTFGPNPVPLNSKGNSASRNSPGSAHNTLPNGVNSNAFSTSSPKSFDGSRTSSYSTNPANKSNIADLTGLFSPSVLATASRSNSTDYISYPKNSPSNQRNGSLDNGPVTFTTPTSDYTTASPSASSISQNGLNSSCGTTPEPSADSPEQRRISDDGQEEFCKTFSTACGNKQNPVPLMYSEPEGLTPSVFMPKTPGSEFPSLDWMASQNGGGFEPLLFGDYRDPQESIMNELFDAAYPITDLTPTHESLDTILPPKRDLMQQIEDTQSGKEPDVVPGDGSKQFLTCNMLWDRVQRSEKVQSGEADMDDLCSQLKAKAKCSGSGAVIDQKDVDAILGPTPDVGKPNAYSMFR